MQLLDWLGEATLSRLEPEDESNNEAGKCVMCSMKLPWVNACHPFVLLCYQHVIKVADKRLAALMIHAMSTREREWIRQDVVLVSSWKSDVQRS